MKGPIELRVDQLKGILDPRAVARKALPVFLRNTPYRTGNARQHTDILNDGTTIAADYPYATRLDQGWSRQSPQGMVRPTLAAIREYLKNHVGK